MSPMRADCDEPARRRLAELAEQVARAGSCDEVQTLLHLASLTLGAERSFFASISGEGTASRYGLVLDCDASWWHRYRAACPPTGNPWFAYAVKHSAPILATQLGAASPQHRRLCEVLAAAGFASAMLVPAHSHHSDHRASLLCLGHSTKGYFEAALFDQFLVAARSFALELHGWWARHEQGQLARQTRLSSADVSLLERHCAGLSSKQIAAEQHVSCEAINSRFQRIIAKVGVRNRRAAARVAVDCGLIVV